MLWFPRGALGASLMGLLIVFAVTKYIVSFVWATRSSGNVGPSKGDAAVACLLPVAG